MSHRIFEYYQEELRYLYEAGKEFSQAHPDAAELLDFEKSGDDDPFVRRLVESFAFLTARVQMKLDDDFPQIAAAMLEKILPLATRAFPAFSVVQFHPGDQIKPGGEFLPRHETKLLLDGQTEVQLRTCYDTACCALDITGCQLKRDFPEAKHALAKEAVSALKITIEGNGGLPLNAALGNSIRFFVSDRDVQFELSELIFNSLSLLGVGFQLGESTWSIPASQLRVLGFQEDELVLPPFHGLPLEYQLLMELFAYPSKHLFFDLPVPPALLNSESTSIEIYLYFGTSNERLEALVGKQSLRLNCCPVVNLFPAQPIAIPINKYCVDSLVDANYSNTDFEIFNLRSVRGIAADGKHYDVDPFYSVEHYGQRPTNSLYYSSRRKFRSRNDGTDVFLSLVDLTMQPAEDNKFTQVLVEPLCCNRRFRDLNLISARSSNFKVPSSGVVSAATRVSDWQRMTLPNSDSTYYWQLISLLNLNFLLLEEKRQVETLRRMLQLLDRPTTALTKSWIDSVALVEKARTIDRIDSRPWPAVVDGTKIEISLNESRSSNRPGSWYVFACGLNHFFALHAGINSFTEVTIKAAEDGRVLTKFTKRCGTRNLI